MKFVVIAIFIFLAHSSFSQYTVTKVIGNVKKKTGEKISVGTKLKETDVLVFSKPEDKVRVIITGKGTYVLTPSPKAEVEKNSFVEMIKSTIQLKSKEGYLSSRGGDIEKIPNAFMIIDSVNSHHLIAKENLYLFDSDRFKVGAEGEFVLQMWGEGSKPIMKPLKTKDDTLFISQADFKFGSGFWDSPIKLAYYDKVGNSAKPVCDLNPYFDQTGEMEKIIRVIVKETNIKDDETLVQRQAYEEVYEALGKPSDIVFENTFRKVVKGLKKTK